MLGCLGPLAPARSRTGPGAGGDRGNRPGTAFPFPDPGFFLVNPT